MISRLLPDDWRAILSIAENLPEWFTEAARQKTIQIDLKHQEGFVAWEGKTAVGFITLYVADGKLNIGWLGVRKKYQRQGIGKKLLQAAEKRARELGIDEVATYTLGDSIDYAPYEQTRNFYFKNGFNIYQRNKTDNPECPEEIRISKKVT